MICLAGAIPFVVRNGGSARNGVCTTGAERIAAEDAPGCKSKSLDNRLGLKRINGILAACRIIPAACGKKRGDEELVCPYQTDKEVFHLFINSNS